MLIDRATLLQWDIPEVRHTYTERDTMLYALGLGVGANPTDADDLRFTYEKALETLPSMALVLGYPGLWIADPRIGANWKALLHGEQSFTMFRSLPVAATVIGRTRVTDVVDKGAGKGLFVYTERDVVLADSGELLCRLASTSVLRGDGGLGGPPGSSPAPHRMPARAPDTIVETRTLPQAALIYRLSGDTNPLHVDPEVAAAAKFPRPILHGMCTFGIAGLALVRAACGGDPKRLASMAARFTSSVFPGETLRTKLWFEPEGVSFRCVVAGREVTVLDNGWATVSPNPATVNNAEAPSATHNTAPGGGVRSHA